MIVYRNPYPVNRIDEEGRHRSGSTLAAMSGARLTR